MNQAPKNEGETAEQMKKSATKSRVSKVPDEDLEAQALERVRYEMQTSLASRSEDEKSKLKP